MNSSSESWRDLPLTDKVRFLEHLRSQDSVYSEIDRFRKFQAKYHADLPGFIVDCIDFGGSEGPAPYQLDIASLLMRDHRVAVRGPHGLGKTALASWVVLWGILTEDDCKVPTTASAWRQLTKFLWPEVHKWTKRLRWDVIHRQPFNKRELLNLSIKRGHTCEAFAIAAEKADLIEGAHAKRIVYIYDEAKVIPDPTWDATEGAFSSAGVDTDSEAFALAISTPGEPYGRFYNIHKRLPGYEDWTVRHVTKEEAIAAGRLSTEWVEQRKLQWGESSAVYQNRVEGEFCAMEEDSVIPLSWVEAAIERWRVWSDNGFPGTFTGVGVDVGGGGEGADLSTFAICFNYVRIKEIREHARPNPMTSTMEVVGLTAGILRKNRTGYAVVDTIGIGAGVYHRLSEQRFPVIPFVASAGTNYTDQSGELGFADWRSAGWWILREMLEPDSGLDICLPDDDQLIGDLTAPRVKHITSNSRIRIEGKDDIRKRIKRSTDRGDAVMQVLVGPHLHRERSEIDEIRYEPVQIGPDW
jgi:hypothetical protein